MSVTFGDAATIDVEINLDDWPVTWERDAGPFRLALLRRRELLAEAPLGIWRLPHHHGEHLRSAWPAEFEGPIPPARRWELRTPDGDRLAAGDARFPRLWRRDKMSVTLTIVGR